MSHKFFHLGKFSSAVAMVALAACVAPSNPPPARAQTPRTAPPYTAPPRTTPPRTTPPRTSVPVPPISQAPRPEPTQPAPSYPQPRPSYQPTYPPPVAPTYPNNGASRPAPQLESELFELWRAFPGKTGIAVRRIDGGNWSVSQRGNELFPQQSVSKIWVAMTIFDKIDKGLITLNDEVVIGMNDLTLFHQPIRARVLANGQVHETVRSLLEQSITKSDCTANDSLLRYAGGPAAVRAFFREKGITNVRFSEGERHMQSTIAGLTWQQSYSLGNNFERARAAVPLETRSRLLNNYIADPIDGAAPEAIASALGRLARGELLSRSSTNAMIGIMSRTTSGPNRLKAGLPSGWSFVHKTGTGQVLGALQAGYNDVGIMTAPDGTRYAVVVMMGSTTAPIPDRMQMMQGVSRSVAMWHSR